MRQCLLTLLRGSHKKYKCKSSVRKICINWAESDLRLWTQLITLKKHFVSWAASFNSFLDKGGILLPALKVALFSVKSQNKIKFKTFQCFQFIAKTWSLAFLLNTWTYSLFDIWTCSCFQNNFSFNCDLPLQEVNNLFKSVTVSLKM